MRCYNMVICWSDCFEPRRKLAAINSEVLITLFSRRVCRYLFICTLLKWKSPRLKHSKYSAPDCTTQPPSSYQSSRSDGPFQLDRHRFSTQMLMCHSISTRIIPVWETHSFSSALFWGVILPAYTVGLTSLTCTN